MYNIFFESKILGKQNNSKNLFATSRQRIASRYPVATLSPYFPSTLRHFRSIFSATLPGEEKWRPVQGRQGEISAGRDAAVEWRTWIYCIQTRRNRKGDWPEMAAGGGEPIASNIGGSATLVGRGSALRLLYFLIIYHLS